MRTNFKMTAAGLIVLVMLVMSGCGSSGAKAGGDVQDAKDLESAISSMTKEKESTKVDVPPDIPIAEGAKDVKAIKSQDFDGVMVEFHLSKSMEDTEKLYGEILKGTGFDFSLWDSAKDAGYTTYAVVTPNYSAKLNISKDISNKGDAHVSIAYIKK